MHAYYVLGKELPMIHISESIIIRHLFTYVFLKSTFVYVAMKWIPINYEIGKGDEGLAWYT
jgi:hypothetical protein